MQRAGIAELPLHSGKCPRWLFSRMVKLARSIANIVIYEYGSDEFLKRLADPFWFQALGNVLGFDWHSSGVTTTVCGALKEALNKQDDLPVKAAGGKGKVSLKTPEEVKILAERLGIRESVVETLAYASRMSAKVDSAAVQDGYDLYHHVLFFDEKGKWCVVQQGMNVSSHYARRYHWIHNRVSRTSFVNEPHAAICAQKKESEVLDLTSRDNKDVRKACVDLLNEGKKKIVKWTTMLAKNSLWNYATISEASRACGNRHLVMPTDHFRIPLKKESVRLLEKLAETRPSTFEEILEVRGVGAATIRALALTSQLIYGTELSWKDPAKFSFAHGGKDGVPYRVNRIRMETTAKLLEDAIRNAEIGKKEKLLALKRLAEWCEKMERTQDSNL